MKEARGIYKKHCLMCLLGIFSMTHSIRPMQDHAKTLMEGFKLETFGEVAKHQRLLDWFEKNKFLLANKLKEEMYKNKTAHDRETASSPSADMPTMIIQRAVDLGAKILMPAVSAVFDKIHADEIHAQAVSEKNEEENEPELSVLDLLLRGYFINQHVHELVALSEIESINLILVKITTHEESATDKELLQRQFPDCTIFYTRGPCLPALYVFGRN